MFLVMFRVDRVWGGVRMLLVGFRVGYRMFRNVVGWAQGAQRGLALGGNVDEQAQGFVSVL